MNEKKRYQANIGGKDYVIVGEQTKEHMDAVIALVNMQLKQLGELDPNLTMIDRSILMAVNAMSQQILQEDRILSLEQHLKEQQEKSHSTYHISGFSPDSQASKE